MPSPRGATSSVAGSPVGQTTDCPAQRTQQAPGLAAGVARVVAVSTARWAAAVGTVCWVAVKTVNSAAVSPAQVARSSPSQGQTARRRASDPGLKARMAASETASEMASKARTAASVVTRATAPGDALDDEVGSSAGWGGPDGAPARLGVVYGPGEATQLIFRTAQLVVGLRGLL
jgi:hypothetical protein